MATFTSDDRDILDDIFAVVTDAGKWSARMQEVVVSLRQLRGSDDLKLKTTEEIKLAIIKLNRRAANAALAVRELSDAKIELELLIK